MNTKLLFSCLICGLFLSPASQAKTNSDVQTHKYQQVCKGKKSGDMISFAHKGVIFNGVCQPNAAGKLIFQPPTPVTDAPAETQSRISETQSAPRPMSSAPQQSAPQMPVPMLDTEHSMP